MNSEFNCSRLWTATVVALLLEASALSVDAKDWINLKIQGAATIQSIVPISVDGTIVTAEVTATEAGHSNVWGKHTSLWNLIVEIDATTGAPLRGSGEIIQTNEDGSTITFHTRFEGDRSFTIITGGTGPFENAVGGTRGETVQNPDGTISYKDKGWITGPGLSRGPAEED